MCPVSIGAATMMAVGTGTQVFGALQGAAAQKQAQQSQQRMNDLKAARERTQQIREARARRADVEQKGANENATGSSSVTTGASGIMGQAYGNIQYLGFEQQTGQAMSTARQKEINAGGISSIGGGVAELGGSIFANRKEISGSPDSIFG